MDVFCVMQLQAREKARAPTHKRDSERKSATARQRERVCGCARGRWSVRFCQEIMRRGSSILHRLLDERV